MKVYYVALRRSEDAAGIKGGLAAMGSKIELERGIRIDPITWPPVSQPVELFGHVTLVEGYALANYTGCHALVALRETPGKTVAVMTSEVRLQSLLETALATGNLIAFLGTRLAFPPTPRGGAWAVDVYGIDGVILYSMS